MGERQPSEVILFYAKDGQWEKIENVKVFPEFHPKGVGITDLQAPPDLSTMPMTISLKIHKSWRCKSRKRFTKLLMSKGIDRNNANEIVEIVRQSGLSYSDAWFRLCVNGFWRVR